MPASPQKVHLDTDIGDDIDDALALALILASPELQLTAVTTVFGNTLARARQARTLLQLAGSPHNAIPVAAGCGATLASSPMPGNFGTAASLNKTLPCQDSTCLPESQLPPLSPLRGTDLLIQSLLPGDTIPITIGALTNLAVALTLEPQLRTKIPLIAMMAAEFQTPMAEWNIRCDPEAAHIVFTSGIPIRLITWHIGQTTQFTQPHLDQLHASPRPVAQYLSRAIAAWQNHQNANPKPMPALYDPMSVATLINPQLADWQTGTVTVQLQPPTHYAHTHFTPSPSGPHQIATHPHTPQSLTFLLPRLLSL